MILGLDIGERRIGLALSDALGITAQALATIRRRGWEEDLAKLEEIIRERQVTELVVGLPRNLNGSLGPQAQRVLEFVMRLKECLSLPIITWDERLSTREAEAALREAGLTWRKRRQVVDKVAAAIILQSYLDFRRQGQVG